MEVKDEAVNSKQKKDKSSKAERRALQEAQRVEKAAAKGVYAFSMLVFGRTSARCWS